MLNDTDIKRMRWKCTHRAQLELDVLLGNFLEKHFSNLRPEQQEAFAKLVEMEDRELWPLVVGKRECDGPLQAEVVKLLGSACVVT
jgi:antitoxin CptB